MPLPPLYTLEELCERLHLKPKTLREWLRQAGFAPIHGGNTLLFTSDDIIEICEMRRKAPRRSTELSPPPPISDYQIERRLAALRRRPTTRSKSAEVRARIAAELAERKRARRERNAANRVIGTGNRHGSVPNGENGK